MAPARTPQPTLLGNFVVDYRRKARLTQERLAERLRELGFETKGYVPKVESGRVRRVDRQFLSALSKLSGESVARLGELSIQPSEERTMGAPERETEKLRIAVGHTLWAAPVIAAAWQGRLEDFEVASFALGQRDQGPVRPVDLAWIVPGRIPSAVPGKDHEAVTGLTAPDVIELLALGDVDLGGVPGNLLERSRARQFHRIGTIVDSQVGASVALKPHPECPLPDGAISTMELAGWLAAHDGPVRLAVEPGTIADLLLRDVVNRWPSMGKRKKVDSPDLRALRLDIKTSDLAGAGCSLERLREMSTASGGSSRGEIVGAIAWEPHTSWLERACRDVDKIDLSVKPLYFGFTESGRAEHMTFELALQDPGLDAFRRRAIVQLLRQTWQSVVDMQDELSSPEALRFLAQYFHLQEDRIAEKLSGIRFDVACSMESLVRLAGSPS